MIKTADRIHHIQEYYFSKKLEEIRRMNAQGAAVLNLGIGSPDLPPAKAVTDRLLTSASQDENHAYQAYRSIPELRHAITRFYHRHYGVGLDADYEVLPLLGSKEGIMYISMAFLNPGDTVLVPNPGYPAYKTAAEMMGAQVMLFDLKEENSWLPNLERLAERLPKSAKMMWINYPNMPTGQKANREFYDQVSAFAVKHRLLVVNDNPYSFILNDQPMSLLSSEGAKENALELNSMSKSFNMAGWRVGMVCGRVEYINAVLRVKSNVDSGMFKPVQEASVEALALPREWFDRNNRTYENRRKLAQRVLDLLGCTYEAHQTGLFLWAKIPKGQKSELFVDYVLREKRLFVTPGTVFGTNGEGYVRMSLCANEKVFEQAIQRL